VLHDIRAPTLVLARPDERLVPLDAAAALAAGIRGAQFRALPAGDHNTFDIFDLVGAQLLEFVCDTGGAATSVVFTDIVGSTEQLTTAGDWRGQLDAHDELVDASLEKRSGRRAKRTVRALSAGSSLVFEGLGAHRLKGLPEDIEIFRVAKP
jgi:hypothetical protein